MKIDLYVKRANTVFSAKLNWNDTIDVTVIRNLKKGESVKSWSYIAGGEHHVYLREQYTSKNSEVFKFRLRKNGIYSATEACIIVKNILRGLTIK